jgi:methylenetetrahydrofolate dehydrogenase (NADP+)/methenyltetrahydrofolate cyclohydrolase
MILLDGDHLVGQRLPGLRSRAAAVATVRGRPPALALLAFADDDGRDAPHVNRKVRACRDVGVDLVPVMVARQAGTPGALKAMAKFQPERFDGVFLQFPFPAHVDDDALANAIPEILDIDVMSPGRIARYLASRDEDPPVTVAAGIALLDAYDVDSRDLPGLVIADPSPFATMFREALVRRGANMHPNVAPDSLATTQVLADVRLVVVAAATPGVVSSNHLSPATVAIDVGYYNAGGRGDIERASRWCTRPPLRKHSSWRSSSRYR